MAGTTGLEPATSDVTGRRSNQLNYVPAISLGLFDANTSRSRRAKSPRARFLAPIRPDSACNFGSARKTSPTGIEGVEIAGDGSTLLDSTSTTPRTTSWLLIG